jgi:hypothetical protein
MATITNPLSSSPFSPATAQAPAAPAATPQAAADPLANVCLSGCFSKPQ